jgi:hypothetical protein
MYLYPVSHDIYAVVPHRVWWAPWRWALTVYWWVPDVGVSGVETLATNISKAECIGLMKTLGYEQDIKC